MLLADVTLSTEGLLIIGTLVTALAGAVGGLFKMLMVSHERELKDVKESRQSYKAMADEATDKLVAVSVRQARSEGRTMPAALAAVVPEHSSPTTERQQDVADQQTIRAKLVAASLSLGLPAREAGEPAPAATTVAVTPAPDGPLKVLVNPEGASPFAIQAEAVSITTAAPKEEEP